MFFIPSTSITDDNDDDDDDRSDVRDDTDTRPVEHAHHVSSSVRIASRSPPSIHFYPFPPRSLSAPPSTSLSELAYIAIPALSPLNRPLRPLSPLRFNLMLAAQPIDLSSFDDSDDWLTPPAKPRLYRTASVGNSWGVTSIGRGFNWSSVPLDDSPPPHNLDSSNSFLLPESAHQPRSLGSTLANAPNSVPATLVTTSSMSTHPDRHSTPAQPRLFTAEPVSQSDSPISRSPFDSALSLTPASSINGNSSPRIRIDSSSSSIHPPSARSPSAPRPRRRSSQQRVSLIAGRLSLVSIEPPSPPPVTSPKLIRLGSQSSFISVTSTAPPSPSHDKESFLGGRSISEFAIEGDLGRGAYGLVKKAREIKEDGSLGPVVIIKQIIKMRILADCWKKHPKFGTIPIEIFVMSAISSTSYILPARRPWDPQRFSKAPAEDDPWIEGKAVKGHPSICPLLDFFEDNHYYYLVMPSTSPERGPDDKSTASDLFDLVESYPQGLPPALVRSYVGQIADALCFLHSKGIVHRDIKDENVVLGRRPGSCILIDFGSSGIVRKNGWDTFSGTLDYAGPEILRGERYHGKEQDVWAFGVVAFVLLIGECPFNTAAEAQEGLESPFANASIALDERCGDGKENDGEEGDGGGALGDAAALVRACLKVELQERPTFERILECRFLSGKGGWGMDD